MKLHELAWTLSYPTIPFYYPKEKKDWTLFEKTSFGFRTGNYYHMQPPTWHRSSVAVRFWEQKKLIILRDDYEKVRKDQRKAVIERTFRSRVSYHGSIKPIV